SHDRRRSGAGALRLSFRCHGTGPRTKTNAVRSTGAIEVRPTRELGTLFANRRRPGRARLMPSLLGVGRWALVGSDRSEGSAPPTGRPTAKAQRLTPNRLGRSLAVT